MRLVWTGLLTLVSGISTAIAEPLYSVVVHPGICNELHIANAEPKHWFNGAAGGSFAPEYEYSSLKQNRLDNVTFGRNGQISFELSGPRVVGETLAPGQRFGIDFNHLRANDETIGKALIFTNPERESVIHEPSAQYGIRMAIRFAVFFTPADPRSVRLVESCTYVQGDLPSDNVGCVWVDQNSKPSNGLPYCW